MSSTVPVLSSASAAGVLERAAAAVTARRRADVEVLESVLAWAGCHTVTSQGEAAGWRPDSISTPGSYAEVMFGEKALPIAGDGAPLVAEFAVMELAAVLDVSHEAALSLVGDVLDLAHRLPRLWALVREVRVPVLLAREAARTSRDLTREAAAHADRLLAWQPGRLNPHRVGVLVHEARLYADPDRAIADHDTALAARKVECRVGPAVLGGGGAPGTGEVIMILDEADTIAFDRSVSTLAATMAALGHQGSLDVRRATAVGVLADPQRALDLLAVDPLDPDRPDPEHDPAICVAEDAIYAPATPFGGLHTAASEAVLVFHVTDHDLLTHTGELNRGGVATSTTLGPVLIERLRSWLLTAGTVTIKPVVDLTALDTMAAVDAHDPPARMAEAVRMRDLTCVFPHCGRPAEACDLDHINSYVPLAHGGPPGQTHPSRLAPLCRRHHRAKTFGQFTYRRLPDGSYEWTLPSGARITTDPPTPRPRPLRPDPLEPRRQT